MGYFGNSFSKKNSGLGQRGNLRVPRKVLRRILFEKLSTSKVYWGHTLMDYEWNAETNQYTVKFHENSSSSDDAQPMVAATADLLVAADGVRSVTHRHLFDSTQALSPDNPFPGLRRIGIRLILGIAEFSHPLLEERGFYVLDGKHRLFTMPYESKRFDKTKKNRIMWQLSFSTNETTDHLPQTLDSTFLRDHVVRIVKGWHNPVLDMVESTPLDTIWGTDLMDRDPREVLELIHQKQAKRLVVVGDALHSMSPFKGQGANQALADGPLLAHWLQKASIDSAITSFWREIVQRTAPVVQASRLAARELHSPEIIECNHGFAGVKPESLATFLIKLQEENIGANLGSKLDEQVAKLIETTGVAVTDEAEAPLIGEVEQQKALEYAAAGNVQGLRQLSLLKHSESIRSAADSQSLGTCLHLAAKGGHAITVKWLLMEVNCDATKLDCDKRLPMDYANDKATLTIFQSCL